ncbi:type IX secretion system membrane protein PorP/SprF [Flavobacterium aquidurense]|uniref:PorP/SprF family type IX secretion system membrane protein n=1 Tax=Flavobacterium aquidurense TaxID=362413 RepID=UPI00285C1624|nr:type IX secretion system membrane protein PorP/SprF [Flavobacterium aquidurense]MDR7371485.1 type IX secretion system PorP/SprF family membrane protein [Flavobacterium aquidurense]
MNSNPKKILIFVAALFLTYMVRAQNDAKLSIFNYNPLIYNPAFAGAADGLNIAGIYSSQWYGFDGAPKTLFLSADTKLPYKKIGLGLSLYHDVIGPAREYNIEGNFAYYIDLNYKYKLALGLKSGLNSYKVDLNQLDVYQPGEDVFNSGFENHLSLIMGLGINLYSDKFFIGISTPNVLASKYYNSNYSTVLSKRKNNYYLNTGYKFELRRDVSLTPAALIRVTEGAPISVLTSLNLNWYEKYIASLNFDYNSSVGLLFGVRVFDNFKVGYSYDQSITKFSRYNNGTHTFLLTYTLLNENSEKCSCKIY